MLCKKPGKGISAVKSDLIPNMSTFVAVTYLFGMSCVNPSLKHPSVSGNVQSAPTATESS